MKKNHKQQILNKLAAENLTINSPWDKIHHCLNQTVAPDYNIKMAKAIIERAAARQAMETIKPHTRAWREAEENLNFWQGKLANLEAFANR